MKTQGAAERFSTCGSPLRFQSNITINGCLLEYIPTNSYFCNRGNSHNKVKVLQGSSGIEDILEELPDDDVNINTQSDFLLSSPVLAEEAPDTILLETMGFDPVHPDLLAQKLNIDAALLYQELLMLELAGKIKTTTGGRFQRLF